FSDMGVSQFIGMIALCIILFSGGISTKISAIRPVVLPGVVLSTVGVLLTALATGVFIWWLSGMSWTNIHFAFLPSFLLAATMSSTDSASVFGILGSRKVCLKENLRPLLELESGSNDPMAYMLTILLISAITAGTGFSAGDIALSLVMQFGIGILGGLVFGKVVEWLVSLYLRIGGKGNAEDSSQATSMLSVMILGAVFFTYAVTTDLGGNGYLAVYLLGIFIGNKRIPCRRGIVKFVDGLTWLAQIVVFLMLGLLVNPSDMLAVAPVSLLIGIFIILVGRPASVLLSLAPFRKISTRARVFVSWVGLRGAVPIIFATYPVVAGIEGADQIFNIVFFITLLSLLIQGSTVTGFAKRLGLVTHDDEAADFGVELSEELPTSLTIKTVDEQHLREGDKLRDLHLPAGTLVMLIRRKQRYIVPNGNCKLHVGDELLVIKDENAGNE
ncbi:MAG: potassium/proton antiporter, partial [Muribaculaceae bacterium]|nr:potassium/proton antiporter [Muribaculaceae bacterium]